MDLLKSINANLKEQAALEAEVRAFILEMDKSEDRNLFRLDEFIGDKARKEKAATARAKMIDRGKVGSVNKNKEGDWQGGEGGEGRLADLIKLFGKPVFDNGKPPRRPEGMSPEDYKIWIEGMAKDVKDKDLGPAVGPDKNDVIRVNGKMFLVVRLEGLHAVIKREDGKIAKVDWTKLSKPKVVDNRQVFTYMSSK